jgi:hypothetical protein
VDVPPRDQEPPRITYLGQFLTRMCSTLTPSTPASADPRIGPVSHQRLGPARLARRTVLVKKPPDPNYISMGVEGSFSSQRSAAFGELHSAGRGGTAPCSRRPSRATASAAARSGDLDRSKENKPAPGRPDAASSARREFGGLAIVSPEPIGDDGARPEVGWVPVVMDEPPVPWQLRGTLH